MSSPRDPRAAAPATVATDRALAFCLLRLLLGVNFFGHGFIRLLHGDAAFAAGMVHQLSATPLPAPFVNAFGRAVPFVEIILGTLLILGLLTRPVLIAGMLFLCCLMLGVTLHEDWATAGGQLVYGLVFAALLAFRADHDRPWLAFLARSQS